MPSDANLTLEADDNRFRLPPESDFHGPVIKVIGIGGGGGNAIQHMVQQGLTGVDFMAANTDAQALGLISDSVQKIQLGQATTKGLGAGADPERGCQAAKESEEQLSEALLGANLLFVAAGMGGGTGTGAAPVVCRLAKDRRILTVAVVTKPFEFEQKQRMQIAEDGIEALRDHVDSLIVIPNDKLLSELGEESPLFESFGAADEVLTGAVRGISDLVNRVGTINLDFADVRTVMSETGLAVIASCRCSGDDRAILATEGALKSPLLEDVDLGTAKAALINVYCHPATLKGSEYKDVGETIQSHLSESIVPMIGLVRDESMGEAMRVTVVVTGIASYVRHQASTRRQEPGRKFGRIERPESSADEEPSASPATPKMASRRGRTVSKSDYVDVPSFLKHQAE